MITAVKRCALFSLLVLNSFATQAEPVFRAAYLSPEPLDTPFWGQIVSFMQAVAEDLNIELDIVVSPTPNRYRYRNEGLKLIKKVNRPDYFVTSYFPGVTPAFIETSKEHNVKVFVFNTTISAEDKKKLGLPREQFANWIGHMYPDGTRAGFLLADILLGQARIQFNNLSGNLQLIALRGPEDPSVDTEDWRTYGLERRVRSSDNVTLIEEADCDWMRTLATTNTLKLLNENPNIRIIWAASDEMALGGADAVASVGKKPGKDVLIGGFDWAPEALQAIADGKMTASLGGHFMEAGWVLVLLHDYHHGVDFVDDVGTQILTPMEAITAENIKRYMEKFSDHDWTKVDFKQFSKVHNPQLKKYDFTLKALLK